MSNFTVDWNTEADLPLPYRKKPFGGEDELTELLWRNGQLVLNSQTNKKSNPIANESKQINKNDERQKETGNSSGLMSQGDETVSWLQYPLEEEESIDKEFYSNFFGEFFQSNPLPAPDSHAGNRKDVYFSQLSDGQLECSVMTVGSSHCGSNEADLSRVSVKENEGKMISRCQEAEREIPESTNTSSSDGSDSSFRRIKQCTTSENNLKRKARDADGSCQSEAVELESAARNKKCQRSGPSRRTRAAEVHNQSERRRRDRINERMRALQELIPHCNKTDKASMLDEAIEYLKSLQLQLQLMWMGNNMAPLMIPGMQRYMSQTGMAMKIGMGMGMGPSPLPSLGHSMHLQGVPLVDQSVSIGLTPNHAAICQTPISNSVNYPNQMQSPNFQDQYARFMSFQQMQNASQPINMFSFGSQTVPQSQQIVPPGRSSGPLTELAAIDAITSKLG